MSRALSALQQYMIVTANYWAFTLTDGALRMLVVFHFHELTAPLRSPFYFFFMSFLASSPTSMAAGWELALVCG